MRNYDNESWTTREEAEAAHAAATKAGTEAYLAALDDGCWVEAGSEEGEPEGWGVGSSDGEWWLLPADEGHQHEDAPEAPAGFVWVLAER